jgi:hypothetical protein
LKLPVITNPNLQWLGFFGQPTPNESGYEPDAQRGIATFGCDENLTTLVRVSLILLLFEGGFPQPLLVVDR